MKPGSCGKTNASQRGRAWSRQPAARAARAACTAHGARTAPAAHAACVARTAPPQRAQAQAPHLRARGLELPGAVQVGVAGPLDKELARGPGVGRVGRHARAVPASKGDCAGLSGRRGRPVRPRAAVPGRVRRWHTRTRTRAPTAHKPGRPSHQLQLPVAHLWVITRSTSSRSAARSSSGSRAKGTLRARFARLSASSSSSLSGGEGEG